ncbi:hypothetical protein HS7_18290 [Sulfolobales archaeon HS-7]|nr:hypothetical protein HS7_18290 [Sulfolobales archaeon HS-7]
MKGPLQNSMEPPLQVGYYEKEKIGRYCVSREITTKRPFKNLSKLISYR